MVGREVLIGIRKRSRERWRVFRDGFQIFPIRPMSTPAMRESIGWMRFA
ncbi:hypothetical protein D3OALGA1CA_1966 [Olavius algarvensis associated proteobacterium Delta 3]|nr:hypothetical protein D3OALGA1CA_1966 [Olavius algarvensis associated proteobacterium Delta 3]